MRTFQIYCTTFAILVVTTFILQMVAVPLGGKPLSDYWVGTKWIVILSEIAILATVATLAIGKAMEADNEALGATPGTPPAMHFAKFLIGVIGFGLAMVLYTMMLVPPVITGSIQEFTRLHDTKYVPAPLTAIAPAAKPLPKDKYELLVIKDLAVPSSEIGAATKGEIVLQIAVDKTAATDGIPVPVGRGFKTSKIWFRASEPQKIESKTSDF